MAADAGSDRRIRGARAEAAARAELEAAGLRTLATNVGYRGGELDLVMLEPGRTGDTLVFVEVRRRGSFDHGGAAASVTRSKQMRIIFAARHYLQRHCRVWPPCRFDVVAIDGDTLTWLIAAFDAG